MVMRVSTFGQTSTVLANALNTQAKLAQKQLQQSSGLLATDYAGLGTSAGAVVDMEVSVSRAKATISAAETILTRVEEQHAVLGSMSDILTEMRTEISSVLSSVDTDALQMAAREMLEEFTALLNSQYQGRYLFAGSDTSVQPVDTSALAVTDLTTPDTSYYLGDGVLQTAYLSEDRTLTYGVTADNTAFEEALRALSYMVTADPLDTADLEALNDLIVSAQDGVIALQSSMGYKAASLESLIEAQSEYVAAVEGLVTDLTSVDVAQVAVDAANYKTQLEASYSALGTLTSLSLLDYLR